MLPYIKNNDAFIERIKFSMNQNLCKTIDFDCFIHDFMAMTMDDSVLSEEGYDILQRKYAKEIEGFISDIKKQ